MKKTRVRISPQRVRLLRAMARGKSVGEAAKIAGYSHTQSASNAIKFMRTKMPEVLDKAGLTDEALITKYLKPLMSAEETQFFQHQGIVLDKRTTPALSIRVSALDMALRLKDAYPNRLEVEHSGAILHVMTETEKKEAVESLERITAFESSSEHALLAEVVEE